MKRLFDMVVAGIALLVALLVMAVLALLVRISMGSPVLFRQTRPGLRGTPFTMLKFRTMRDAHDRDGNPLADAERITRMGQMLRSTSLDELPELWNVLKGDMSLVGPRPLLMEYLPLYTAEQARRHDVRPGVTGWAQVNGRNALGWEEKFALDTWYVDNRSFILDVKILFLTVAKVLRRDGISADGEATMARFQGNAGPMTALVGIYGASGCGRGIMPLLRAELAGSEAKLVFIDDARRADRVNGHEVWTFERFADACAGAGAAALAIADARVRAKLDRRCTEAGVRIIGARAANIVVMDDVEIGPGALLSPFVTLTSNIRIGRCFHANLYSYVEHDCVIGDYVTFAPGVHCNGNVTIADHAYIGSGAVIRQGLRIGAGATVGMGAVVTKDVPEGAIVVGNPAHMMENR